MQLLSRCRPSAAAAGGAKKSAAPAKPKFGGKGKSSQSVNRLDRSLDRGNPHLLLGRRCWQLVPKSLPSPAPSAALVSSRLHCWGLSTPPNPSPCATQTPVPATTNQGCWMTTMTTSSPTSRWTKMTSPRPRPHRLQQPQQPRPLRRRQPRRRRRRTPRLKPQQVRVGRAYVQVVCNIKELTQMNERATPYADPGAACPQRADTVLRDAWLHAQWILPIA